MFWKSIVKTWSSIIIGKVKTVFKIFKVWTVKRLIKKWAYGKSWKNEAKF
jgi:hypothetical protein